MKNMNTKTKLNKSTANSVESALCSEELRKPYTPSLDCARSADVAELSLRRNRSRGDSSYLKTLEQSLPQTTDEISEAVQGATKSEWVFNTLVYLQHVNHTSAV